MPSLNFELPETYKALQDQAWRVLRDGAEVLEGTDEHSYFSDDLLSLFKDSGLSELMVEGQYGGRFDKIDPLAVCVVREVLIQGSGHLDALFSLQGIGSYSISLAGTEEQKQEWLPKIAKAEALPAMALTEPDHGSDLKNIGTNVREENGKLILNGEKSFISNVGVCNYYIVLAKEGEGHSLILLPSDTPGIEAESGPELLIGHVIGSLKFNDVELPVSARLGQPGQAFPMVLKTLTVFRNSVAGAAVGLAQSALDEAVTHSRNRTQFGRPLHKIAPVAQLLADCGAEIEAARLMAYKAAVKSQNGDGDTLAYASMAKLYASEMANRVVNRCMQTMGRFSLIKGEKIERFYRLVRPMTIYEGASEVLRLGVMQYLVDQNMANEEGSESD